MNEIPINLVVEDSLSEAVLRKLLEVSGKRFAVGACYGHGGFGYIKSRIMGFNNAAKGTPFLVLTDLDKSDCPPVLINEWFSGQKNHNLIFRIAVREVESWLLADRNGFAKFIRIRETLIPADVENIGDPKQFLIDLVRKSPKTTLKNDIIPRERSTAKTGPNYNGRLVDFVYHGWNIRTAQRNSHSLDKTVAALSKFIPV